MSGAGDSGSGSRPRLPFHSLMGATDGEVVAALESGLVSLERALCWFLVRDRHVPAPIARRVVGAFELYSLGETDDLAMEFGIAAPRRARRAWLKSVRASEVHDLVHKYHSEGFPKNDPTYFGGTAFEMAARELGLRPSTVFDIYRGKR